MLECSRDKYVKTSIYKAHIHTQLGKPDYA